MKIKNIFFNVLITMCMWLPILALDNSVTISNNTITTQTDQVRRVPRWFAQGEIQDYPAPYTNDTILTTWQSDIKTRWSDGSVQFAIISFPYTISNNSSVTIDFRASTNACHLGNLSVCQESALTTNEMLSFNDSNWDAIIEAQANPAGTTTTRSVSARTIISDEKYTYWLQGPVVTEIVVDDISRAYDFGWNCTTNCTWPFSTATWEDDLINKNLHPMFVLTFPTGWSGVRIQYILANYWTTARRTARYSITLKSGSGGGTTEWSHAGVPQHAHAWWRKEFWNGTEPGAEKIDFNFAYMIHSKLVFPYDLSLPSINYTPVNTLITGYTNKTNLDFPVACTSSESCGNRLINYGATGGRPDRGFFPQWEALWLYTMDPSLYGLVIGNADHVTSQSLHLRESATGLTYYGATNALGLPLSIVARPTVDTRHMGQEWNNLPTAVGTVVIQNSYNGWGTDTAHQHTHAQLAYFISGEWVFMQEQTFIAHRNWALPQDAQGSNNLSRRGSEGIVTPVDSAFRAAGWVYWNVWRGYLAVPDAAPEKAYLLAKLDESLASWEGYYGIVDGQHYDPYCVDPFNHSTASRWCWGHRMLGYGNTFRGTAIQVRGNTPGDSTINLTYTASEGSPWWDAFVIMSLSDICRLDGVRACAIRDRLSDYYTDATKGNGVTLSQTFTYREPVRTKVDVTTTLVGNITSSSSSLTVASIPTGCPSPPFTVRIDVEDILITSISGTTWTTGGNGRGLSWSDAAAHSNGATVTCFSQFPTRLSQRIGWVTPPSAITPGNNFLTGDQGSYYDMAAAAACLSTEGVSSTRTCEIYRALWHTNELGGYSNALYSHGSDPRWRIIGGWGIRQVVSTGNVGTAQLSWLAPDGAVCKVYLNTTVPLSSSDINDADATTIKLRRQSYSATGLSAGTYYYRITCGTARESGTVVVN